MGELIHSDIAGSYTISKGKSKYVLTFLDDFTRFSWIKAIPGKKSITIHNAFSAWIKINKGIKVQYMRTDDDGEDEGNLTSLLNGASHSAVKQQSRTFKSHPRRNDANLPAIFWAEAMTTAAFVNYLPSKAVDNRIPWGLWYERQISVDTLRKLHPFDSVVHAYVPH